MKKAIDEIFKELLELTNEHSQPNLNALMNIAKDLDNIKLNIKFFGYELARQMADALPKGRITQPRKVGLRSKPSTQVDLESDWASHWCTEMKIPVVFHRKVWEIAYMLQALYENDMISPGKRGLGFGCGAEPMPSYFASKGLQIVVTDLHPETSNAKVWSQSNQHTKSREQSYHAHLVSREQFDKSVSLEYVDMNAIPDTLSGFDFCWSICALEHLGTIQNGLDFIVNSIKTLKPGGCAVHTTEFNFSNDEKTLDNWGCVLFQKAHFVQVADRLIREGHHVAALDFDVGIKPLDKFIDLPPYTHQLTEYNQYFWGLNANHMKVSIEGFPATCFGIIVKKAG